MSQISNIRSNPCPCQQNGENLLQKEVVNWYPEGSKAKDALVYIVLL